MIGRGADQGLKLEMEKALKQPGEYRTGLPASR